MRSGRGGGRFHGVRNGRMVQCRVRGRRTFRAQAQHQDQCEDEQGQAGQRDGEAVHDQPFEVGAAGGVGGEGLVTVAGVPRTMVNGVAPVE